MAPNKSELSARDRLLGAANDLFYAEGVHAVGIDRVIEHAGVAKASLYSTFGSKDELVHAYLESRAVARQERITQRMAKHKGPRQKILSVFDLMGESVVEPNFRGCAFVNASVEGPNRSAKVKRVCADSRGWLRGVFTELAREAGTRKNAELVGRRLALLYDGAVVGASLSDDPRSVAADARAMVVELLDAHTSASKRRRRTSTRA